MTDKKLDERIETELEFLNEISSELNMASVEAKNTETQLAQMVAMAIDSLERSRLQNHLAIEKSLRYLKLLVKMKKEYDALYEIETNIAAAKLSMEQNNLVMEKMTSAVSELMKASNWQNIEEYQNQHFVLHKKLLLTQKLLCDLIKEAGLIQSSLKRCYKKVQKIYSHINDLTYNNGLLYFKQKLFHLRNIQFIVAYSNAIEILFKDLQLLYEEQLEELRSLSKDLENKSKQERDFARRSFVDKGYEKLHEIRRSYKKNKNKELEEDFSEHKVEGDGMNVSSALLSEEDIILKHRPAQKNINHACKSFNEGFSSKRVISKSVSEVMEDHIEKSFFRSSCNRAATSVNLLESQDSDLYEEMISKFEFEARDLQETNFCFDRALGIKKFQEVDLEHLHIAVALSKLEQYSFLPKMDNYQINE